MPLKFIAKWLLLLTFTLLLANCGGGGQDTSPSQDLTIPNQTDTANSDEFSRSEYKGLVFYPKKLSSDDYRLTPLTNDKFNSLKDTQKLQVADTLLSTFFFAYPLNTLKEKIQSENFIDDLLAGIEEDHTDKEWLENYIIDENFFVQYDRWNEPQAINILSRFYAMKSLDKYFINNWIAYILTQTIMFSPAYELESSHTPNISRVYNRIVTMLNVDSGMRYITYVHMMSEDNWRRFRSPEDNGREMLEIFLYDMHDNHVPIAAQALKNWRLNTDSDTLEVSLNQNRKPLNLFNTTIINGDDFYRELVKSDLFVQGVTKRLVQFFFPEKDIEHQENIVKDIVDSHPETWQDILFQIVFSEEYLLHNQRAKSAEETFFSLAKKTNYRHRIGTIARFKEKLEDMHQASMKYKLGKRTRVPLDTLSFAYYHQFIREDVLLRRSNPEKIDDYEAWDRQGWDKSFIANSNFNIDEKNATKTLESFIQYLFEATIARKADKKELALFKNHMLRVKDDDNQTKVLDYPFNILEKRDDIDEQKKRREARKREIAMIVLDYISRLAELYTIKEVK